MSKRAVPSPEPYIKQEPPSPPHFAAYVEGQPSKRRALPSLVGDMDVVTLQEEGRAQPIYYREQESNSRAYREVEPSSPTVIHVPQQRRVQRDEHDLRRVASLQYARRPHSPGGGGEVFPMGEPRQVRAASHAFVDGSEPTMYREASVRASAAPVHYVSRQPSPVLMAPPPRRIVVDQYGNKYYAAPVDARESMAPPSRRIEVDPYYERAVTREPTMRGPVRTDVYEEDIGMRMPPPPRRYVEASDVEVMERAGHSQRASSRRPVEVEMEYRPMGPYSEVGAPREYARARAYSMRPESIRQHEVPEGYVRHESVQAGPVRVTQAPRFREVSMSVGGPAEGFDQGRFVGSRQYVGEGSVEGRRVYGRY